MFDLPDAKRVRRADLLDSPHSSRSHSPASDALPDPELEAKLQAHFASLYGPSTDLSTPHTSSGHRNAKDLSNAKQPKVAPELGRVEGGKKNEKEGHKKRKSKREEDTEEHNDATMDGKPAFNVTSSLEDAEEKEQSFEFRLFSNRSNTSQQLTTQKIILEPDAPHADLLGEPVIQGDGGFLQDRKDPRVWLIGQATGEKLEEFRRVAISGECVKEESAKRNWGLEVPWRVTVLKSSSGKKMVSKADIGEEKGEKGKRKKPGKKRRIALRMKVKKVEEEKGRKEREGKEKEEADRERKTRKNREKKVKQKMRARAKAQTVADAEGAMQMVKVT